MCDPGNLEELCALAPDFVGFIFYPPSKRFVGSSPDPALFRVPANGIKKVGVFVNEELSRVRKVIEDCALDVVQLHGGESVEYCQRLAGKAKLMKVLDPGVQSFAMESYAGAVDWFLFDTPGEGYGGTGQKFDWTLLKDLEAPAPFLLSGGIAPGDANAIGNLDYQGMMGIDLNSRFELSPGLKDIQKLKEFFTEIRNQRI